MDPLRGFHALHDPPVLSLLLSILVLSELTMNIPSLVVFISLLWLTISSANAETSVYELTLEGKQCKETSNQSLGCEYRIGKTLHIGIDGIGQRETVITFMKSDIEGDFYASLGLLHGCIVVKRKFSDHVGPLLFNLAFISPRTGKVYRTWQECGSDG